MKKIYFCLIILCSLFINIYAQFNEVQVLLNQGRTHESRNQFTQALEVYGSLYEKYPTREDVVEPYLRVLFNTSRFDRARDVLDASKNRLNAYFLTRQECLYAIKTSNPREAEKIATDWLTRNPGQMQHYRDFAAIFESAALFDGAINIYSRGRQVANDQNLYALELSNAYYFIKNVDKFFEEAIKNLRLNSGYLYYYRTRFKEFVQLSPENIRKLDRLIRENEPEQVWEIYAFALVDAKDFAKATTIYEKLPLAKMIKFADDLKSDGERGYALATYLRILDLRSQPSEDRLQTSTSPPPPPMPAGAKVAELTGNPVMYAEIQFKVASIFYELNDIDNSIAMLEDIINNADIQKPPHSHRTKVNKDARLLMALISMQQNKSIAETRRWFELASSFTNNLIEKSDILFQLSRYLYLKEDYTQAYRVIETAVAGQDFSTNIYKQSNFYRYEIALFQDSADKDSLMVECIIHFPEDVRITEMLFLELFLNSLGDHKAQFLQAMRYKGLYQDELAIQTLLALAEQANIDELYIMAYEWGINSSNYELVSHIKTHQFSNPVLNDFVFLQLVRQQTDAQVSPTPPNEPADTIQSRIINFLSNNPQNVFSPQLRLILSKIVNS